MFCIPKNHQTVLYERDYAAVSNEGAKELSAVLKRLPQMQAVEKPVRKKLLRLAEICDGMAASYGSHMTVSVDENGEAVRFLMKQHLFGVFLPKLSDFSELISLATAFTVTPSAENVCVTIDFALAVSLFDLSLKQAQRGLPDLES